MNGQSSITEKVAAFVLRQEGWTVVEVSDKPYGLEMIKPGKRVAVAVFDQRRRVQLAQVEKLAHFLDSPEGAEFSEGMVIGTAGFSRSVLSYLRDNSNPRIEVAQIKGTEIVRDLEQIEFKNISSKPIYIGVFTSKGGVGKTTVSAHLAGAFATNGYQVALVDLDGQRNLRKLLGNEVYVPISGKQGVDVSVFTGENWNEEEHPNTKIIVCDCSPDFDSNPYYFVNRFDYCIIPTTLNPLGINKNGVVIRRTLEEIRAVNHDARLFVLINSLQINEERRNTLLSGYFKRHFDELMRSDQLFQYIDPNDVAIRFSKQLLYWGFHLFDGTRPELAFGKIGQYSNPRIDFLKLVDYLEETTLISQSKESEVKKSAIFC